MRLRAEKWKVWSVGLRSAIGQTICRRSAAYAKARNTIVGVMVPAFWSHFTQIERGSLLLLTCSRYLGLQGRTLVGALRS
jgi:hypothetical protein